MPNPLESKAKLAKLNIRLWQSRKFDRYITDEVNQRHKAKDDAGRWNKLLLQADAFSQLNSVARNARATFHTMTQPWLDDGQRVIPNVLIDDFGARFRKYREDYGLAIKEFVKAYPQLVLDQKERLGDGYRAEDYPPAQEIPGRFGFSYLITGFPPFKADDLRTQMSKEDVEDMQNQLDNAVKDAMRDPVRRIVEVVEHMTKRLKEYQPASTKSGGKVLHSFRASVVDNIRELSEIIPHFNLTGDKALNDLISRMTKELCAVDADDLRKDHDTRKAVVKSAEDILKSAEALMA